jgi:hypothetical protein
MTKALFNALLFEAASLGAAALAWAMGQPAVALVVFVALHLPGSLLMFPVLVAVSTLFDYGAKAPDPWPFGLLPICAGIVVGIQAPLLIAGFRWHLGKQGATDPARPYIAVRSLGLFAAASACAVAVVAACLWLTPIRMSGNCDPLPPDMPPPEPTWRLNGFPADYHPLIPFATLRHDRFSTITEKWWGLFELQSPWRFAMLGVYAAVGMLPGLWILARSRNARTVP